MASNELRLFVSSTFRDLMPEREQLVKKVFPRIRKECRARGVEFTEIDLRWGITEEESRSGKTIRICLEEIDRCRPYFIGIIGSRYGWIPGITEIEKDPEMLKEFPWLQEYAASEKSIIEMEFAHGAVLQKNDSAFFYEQSIKDLKDASDFNDAYLESIESLESLKNNIAKTGLPYRRFAAPEELGEQVFQDILTILDRDFPIKKDLTPLERERIEHEAYARNRRQSYIANPEYYDAFVKHIESDGPPLIIWGKSGLGKSALMAYLAHEYQMQNPDAFVVQHFIGAAEGSDPEDVMRQVMMEIKERYGLSDAIPTDDNNVREEFPVWLAKVGTGSGDRVPGTGEGNIPIPTSDSSTLVSTALDSRIPDPGPQTPDPGTRTEKLILLIDALNQLTGIAPEMHWLPEFFPPNVRIIVSTTTDSLPLEQLRKRNWNELPLGPLTEQQRKSISREFLNRFHKSLPPDDLHTLSIDTKSSSPLFLRTVLEELRIFGHHQSLHSQLEDYLTSADERDLFQKVLARMERDHGAQDVRDVLTAIWASRHGLSESELMEITGMSRMALSELMIAMEYHLMQREGFYTFFHNFLREGIQLRYLEDEELQKAAHSRMGEYFATREYGNRRRDEEPWQWQAAQQTDRLSQTLSDPEILLQLTDEAHIYQYNSYWRSIEDKINIAEHFSALIGELAAKEIPERFTKITLRLVEYFIAASHFNAAQYTINQLKSLRSDESETDNEKILSAEAAVLYNLGEYQKALPVYAKLKEMYEGMPEHEHELIDALLGISTIQYMLASYKDALANSLAAHSIAEKIENAILIVDTLTNASACMAANSNLDGAIGLAKEALEVSRKGLGAEHPKTLFLMTNLAALFRQHKDWQEAEVLYILCEDIIGHTLGKKSTQFMAVLQNHAVLKFYEGKNEEAIDIHQYMLSIYQHRGISEDHPEYIKTALSLGSAFAAQGKTDKALEIYEKYLPLRIKRSGESHPEVLNSKNRYAEILKRKEEEDAHRASS